MTKKNTGIHMALGIFSFVVFSEKYYTFGNYNKNRQYQTNFIIKTVKC